MVVHFSSSARNLQSRIQLLRDLCEAITTSGHKIARDWLDEAYYATPSERSDLKRWKKISELTLTALQKADAVIIEATIDSFSMGYQAALATQLKKPLLILRQKTDDGVPLFVDVHDSSKPVEHSLIAGQKFLMSKIVIYSTVDEAKEIINKFLESNDISTTDMRFNMFLDRESYMYLKQESVATGKTRAKIIRDMIHKYNAEHDN